jgi:pimeloyl-ACP methyl ester carboxylesterase
MVLTGALMLALAACTSSPTPVTSLGTTSGSGGNGSGTIAWKPCNDIAQQVLGQPVPGFTFDCGSVTVPQDWHNPHNGKTFSIALVRVHNNRETDPLGSLLMNPGGPGVSGVDDAVGLIQELPNDVSRRFDLIGFDPRGVGRSAPITCLSAKEEDASYAADPDPVAMAGFNQLVTLTKQLEAACGKKYGSTLQLFSTEQTARDIDAIRIGLGESKINFLGYSYGTLLGGVYAELFPHNIRAMVLDGAIDPLLSSQARSEAQAAGFQRAFGDFVAWCKANANQCPISRDPQGAVVAAINKARTVQLTYTDGRKVTSGWVFLGVIQAMYLKAFWPVLGQSIALLGQGNPVGIMRLADAYAERNPDGSYSNLLEANLAVNCADFAKEPTVAQIRVLQSQWRQKYPLFGASSALGLLSCAPGEWPGKPDPYPIGPAKGAPPILVVGTKNDPATPYEGTAKLANMLGVGEVLTWDGDGHTAYPQTTCITTAVDNYLLNLTMPPKNTVCPPS